MANALDLIKEEKQNPTGTLDLGNCGLTELPDALFELTHLHTLILSATWIEYDWGEKEWKGHISQNEGKANQLKNLSPQLELLRGLKKLILSNQKELTDLAPLKDLAQLQELYIYYTQVSDLSPLKDLAQLQELDFSSTQVSDLSPLKDLAQLQLLDVSLTQVSDLSPLKDLTQLQLLDVSLTQVSDLSPLKDLTQLQRLYVSGTQVGDLAPLKDLAQLQQLSVSKTQVSYLAPLKNLVQLKQLHVSETQVSDLSPLKDLAQLQQLSVSNTQVSDLSPLKNLAQLQLLDVALTQVSDLSPLKVIIQIGIEVKWDIWDRGNGIFVKDCPLDNPPKEIVEQGNEAILSYWAQIEEQGGTEELYEAKMIIVGEGGTGKTTLFKKLQDPALDIRKNPTTETHGINVKEGWTITHRALGNLTFQAHIWDFGGQELQYMTHQFFLTPRALYVLLMDARKESDNLAYWFKIMSLLGRDEKDSTDKVRLIMVFNKQANSTGTAPQYQDILKYYADDFNESYIEVDLAENDDRFKSLKQTIEDSLIQLPIVKSELPRLWKSVREALKERAKEDSYISQKEFANICKRIGIKKSEDQELLSGYLHKLGAILHFQEEKKDLMDTIFLSPQWVVKGVYAVLEDVDFLKFQKGRFTTDYILDALRKKGYESSDAQKILQLMTKDKFDICYESSPNHFVAAQLLPDDAPKFRWHNHKGALKFRYQYPIMPKGLMSRLIVRLSEYIEHNDEQEETVWKKGAVLRMGFDGTDAECRILLQEDNAESKDGLQQILIEVLGDESYRRDALRRVRDEVDKLHRQWFKNIQFDEMIPCSCVECQSQAKPKLFKLNDILLRKTKKNYYGCPTGEDVSIDSLLEGIYTSEELTRKQLRYDSLQHFKELAKLRDKEYSNFNEEERDSSVSGKPKPTISKVEQHIHINDSQVTLTGRTESVSVKQQQKSPPSVSAPQSTPFWETHLGKSLIKGIVLGIAVAIFFYAAAQFIDFKFVWQTATVSGLLYFLISYGNDPKHRFSRFAMWILGTWLVIGQILPSFKALFNIQSQSLNGIVEIINDNNPWVTIVALVLSGLLFWLDFQNNKTK